MDIVAEASGGKVLLEQGDCCTQVTPAWMFKTPLAVVGFDGGFLKDEHNPAPPY